MSLRRQTNCISERPPVMSVDRPLLSPCLVLPSEGRRSRCRGQEAERGVTGLARRAAGVRNRRIVQLWGPEVFSMHTGQHPVRATGRCRPSGRYGGGFLREAPGVLIQDTGRPRSAMDTLHILAFSPDVVVLRPCGRTALLLRADEVLVKLLAAPDA